MASRNRLQRVLTFQQIFIRNSREVPLEMGYKAVESKYWSSNDHILRVQLLWLMAYGWPEKPLCREQACNVFKILYLSIEYELTHLFLNCVAAPEMIGN
jgi:hypothetical protein